MYVHRRPSFNLKLKINNNLGQIMIGLIIKWFLINRFQNEHVLLELFCSLFLQMIIIRVKSFYLRHAESSLEVHSLTTYIFVSNCFKCKF